MTLSKTEDLGSQDVSGDRKTGRHGTRVVREAQVRLIARLVVSSASGRGLIQVSFSLSSRANRGRKIGGIHIFLNKHVCLKRHS